MTTRNENLKKQFCQALVCSSARMIPLQNAALWLAVCLCVIVLRIMQQFM